MKTKICVLAVILLLISCSEENSFENCSVDNPIEGLYWLKTIKDIFEKGTSSEKSKIYQYTYRNETVFLIDGCVGCPDFITALYNCLGEKICEFGGFDGRNTCPDFLDKATNKKLLWRNYDNVIIDKERYNTTKTDSYEIIDISINKNILTVIISSGGCDGSSWNVNLIDSGDISESLPLKRELKLELINNEACLAIVKKEIQYDISKLQHKGVRKLILSIDKRNKNIEYKY